MLERMKAISLQLPFEVVMRRCAFTLTRDIVKQEVVLLSNLLAYQGYLWEDPWSTKRTGRIFYAAFS